MVEVEALAVQVGGQQGGAELRSGDHRLVVGAERLDLVRRAGGDERSSVQVFSFEPLGAYNQSVITGPQLGVALLATHLNGQRLDLDHGYPLRLIAPNRAGVLNTKWLSRVVVS